MPSNSEPVERTRCEELGICQAEPMCDDCPNRESLDLPLLYRHNWGNSDQRSH